MGGVDNFDQRIQYYSYPHKCKKWWKYYFHFLVEIALNNSFIIFNATRRAAGKDQVSFLDFRLAIVVELTGWKHRQEAMLEAMKIDVASNDRHELIPVETRQDCFYCKSLGIRSSCKYANCSITAESSY